MYVYASFFDVRLCAEQQTMERHSVCIVHMHAQVYMFRSLAVTDSETQRESTRAELRGKEPERESECNLSKWPQRMAGKKYSQRTIGPASFLHFPFFDFLQC